MKLCEWTSENQPKESLIYGKSASRQFYFVRDSLPSAYDSKSYGDCETKVVSTHRSKSCILPVYELWIKETRVLFRGNFHDWKVSVQSKKPLVVDHRLLWDPHNTYLLQDVYFEGFSKSDVFPPYGDGSSNAFSVCLGPHNEILWAFMRELWLSHEDSA